MKAIPETENNSRIKSWAWLIILLGLLYFPLFQHLDAWVIRMWDESRLAISAVEMAMNGNPIVTFYNGNPDLWSTKPPLLIWWQSLCFQVFGWSELSYRIPVALCALFLCLALYRFGTKQLGSRVWGVAAALALVSVPGFVGWHSSRTGDYDIPLTLFTTLAGLSWFMALETEGREERRWILLTMISLAFAVLTKGVAGLMFGPALLVYTVLRGRLWRILKSQAVYISFALFLVMVFGYYGLRELVGPGYLEAVWNNELGGRYLQEIEGHEGPFSYYFDNWLANRWYPWMLALVAVGAVIGSFFSRNRMQRFTLWSILAGGTYMLIVSAGQTKLLWYDLPAYPWMVGLLATLVVITVQMLARIWKPLQQPRWNLFAGLLLTGVLLAWPYAKAVHRTYHPQEVHWDKPVYAIAYFLREVQRGDQQLEEGVVVKAKYPHVNQYYIRSLIAQDKNFTTKPLQALEAGEQVIANYPEDKDFILAHFNTETVSEWKTVTVYRLLESRTPE